MSLERNRVKNIKDNELKRKSLCGAAEEKMTNNPNFGKIALINEEDYDTVYHPKQSSKTELGLKGNLAIIINYDQIIDINEQERYRIQYLSGSNLKLTLCYSRNAKIIDENNIEKSFKPSFFRSFFKKTPIKILTEKYNYLKQIREDVLKKIKKKKEAEE